MSPPALEEQGTTLSVLICVDLDSCAEQAGFGTRWPLRFPSYSVMLGFYDAKKRATHAINANPIRPIPWECQPCLKVSFACGFILCGV